MPPRHKPDPKEEQRRVGGVRSDQINLRCSATARWVLESLQAELGLSQSSVFEMLLREEARRRSMVLPGSGEDKARLAALAEEIRAHGKVMGG